MLGQIAPENVHYLAITGYASPDGSSKYNRELSRARASALLRYLETIPAFARIEPARVRVGAPGENWDGLRRLVEADAAFTSRGAVVRIIDSNVAVDTKKYRLRQLDNGRAYGYMLKNMFPALRSAAEATVILAVPAVAEKPAVAHASPLPAPLAMTAEPARAETVAAPQETAPVAPQPLLKPSSHKPLLALKTNLPPYLAGVLNAEIEVPVHKRWSVNAEGQFAWWSYDNTYCSRIAAGGIEARYWFGERSQKRVLTGWFAGASIWGSGKFDFQCHDGVQGDYLFNWGLTGGYACRFSRHPDFGMEFSLGVGMMKSMKYYKYSEPEDGYPIWEKTKRIGFPNIVPTKAKISLVWLINNRE